MKWRRTFASTIALCLLCCSAIHAQITVTPAQAPVGKKVVATVSATVPEGATFEGGWSVSCDGATCRAELADLKEPNSVGIWSPVPGQYTLTYSGFWLLLKEVSFKDGDGNTVTITSYLGHGFINERATFTLEGENGPDPPEPQPGGPWKIVLFYDSQTLDDMTPDQQAIMRGEKIKEVLKESRHELLQRVEGQPSSYPQELRDFMEAVRGKSLPRVALQSLDGGVVLDYPLPETWEGFLASLNDPKLEELLK